MLHFVHRVRESWSKNKHKRMQQNMEDKYMGGIGFPFLNNRDCDRAKTWGCGGGCGGGCNSGCNSGCGWGGKLGGFGRFGRGKGRGCNKGCGERGDDDFLGLGNMFGW